MKVLTGTGVCAGIVTGPVFFYQPGRAVVSAEKITDTVAEWGRFETARQQAKDQLRQLYEKTLAQAGEENAAIFDIHQMMLDDQDYLDAVRGLIEQGHDNAARAVQKTGARFAHTFEQMDDEYMQARAADVQDISQRVIDILLGGGQDISALKQPSIIVAEDLTPSQSMLFAADKVLAFATAKGSTNSHTAILARSKGLPAVVHLGEELLQMAGTCRSAVLDGEKGILILDPSPEQVQQATQKKLEQAQTAAALQKLRGTADRTQSGQEIKLYANAGNLEDLDQALAQDARGIGLFRTEFLYLQADHYPTEVDLLVTYRQAVEKMAGRKIIFRTLDIGADKTAPYFHLPLEENPALGMRAIRLCLARKELFLTQLRALLRASAFGNMSVMFPMIISVEEVQQACALLDEAKAQLRSEKKAFDEKLEIGIMIETPAAALLSAELAEKVDFFSIGTNDLTQYTCAIDRQNPQLADYVPAAHPAVLKLIKYTAEQAHQAGKWVGICGELAADLSLTETFLRMGIDELSVAAPQVLSLRQKIQQIK